MGDGELVAFVKKFIAEKGITGRMELKKADQGLYQTLGVRKLLGELGLEKKRRDWAAMGDRELVALALERITGRGITDRSELAVVDSGLSDALEKRKLLEEVGLKRKYRDWAAMGDRELVALAKKFIADRGITGRAELNKADSRLCQALRNRELLDEAGLGNTNEKDRRWAAMKKDELITFAKEFINERGIKGRGELGKADPSLYQTLRIRKLLAAVFSQIEHQKHKEAVQGVLDAIESFGDDS
jgi:hypothetical protein